MKHIPKPAKALALAPLMLLASSCDQLGSDSTDQAGYKIGDDETIILHINGTPVPEARLAAYAPPGIAISDQVMEQLTNNIVISELLSHEAVSNELHKSVEIREQLEVARQNVLSRAIVTKLIDSNPVSDDEIMSRYKQMSGEMEEASEYNARHILVETQDEAKDIIAEIKADFDKFGDLAREKSIDPGSGRNGGQLGWASPDTYVPEFSSAMVGLEVGGFTQEPVQSQFGWHIITLDEMRKTGVPELDSQLREQITSTVQSEVITSYIDDLRESAEIVNVN